MMFQRILDDVHPCPSKDVIFQFTKCEATMRHFRCFSDIKDHNIDLQDVGNRYSSGSGQFSNDHLQHLSLKVDEVVRGKERPEIWIVDLRAEPHVFINGKPAVWKNERNDINIGKTTQEIIEDEGTRISQIGKTHIVQERKGKETAIEVQNLCNEK